MSEDLNSYMLKTAEGDKDSFRYIANALGYKMHATAIKILGSSHFEDADDIVQISLIKVWQSAPRWKNNPLVSKDIFTKSFFQLVWILLENISVLMNLKIIIPT